MEYGEKIEDCAKRELLEETGLQMLNYRYGPFTGNVFESEEKHYITLFVIATRVSGHVKTKEPEKCDGWKWFEVSGLPEPLFAPLETLRTQGFFPKK